MSKFICKDGASLYYLQPKSGGSFLPPPGHATQKFSIVEKRGGHECGFMSLEYAASKEDAPYLPSPVRMTARALLRKYPGDIHDETWIRAVYTHMRHCYKTPEGQELTFGKFWGNADQEALQPPENHRAVQYIRQYDPSHTPRLDLF